MTNTKNTTNTSNQEETTMYKEDITGVWAREAVQYTIRAELIKYYAMLQQTVCTWDDNSLDDTKNQIGIEMSEAFLTAHIREDIVYKYFPYYPIDEYDRIYEVMDKKKVQEYLSNSENLDLEKPVGICDEYKQFYNISQHEMIKHLEIKDIEALVDGLLNGTNTRIPSDVSVRALMDAYKAVCINKDDQQSEETEE